LAGGGSKSESTSNNQPPSWVAGYLPGYVNQAYAQYYPGGQTTPYPYPNQEVAPFTGMQQAGFDAVSQMGQRSPLVDQAMGFQSNVMSQDALNNPLLNNYYTNAANQMMGSLNSGSVKAGAFGGSGAQDQSSQALSNLATQIYSPAWNQQEQQRQQAAYMSPYLMQSSYYPSQMLLGAGQQQQAQTQNILNAGYQNLYQQAGWPYQVLSDYGDILTKAMGGGGTQTIRTKSG